MEPVTRRPGQSTEPGALTARPVGKCTASTGEQAASSGRQLSYVGAAHADVVAGRPVEGENTGVDSSAPQDGKHRTDEKASR